MDLYRWMAGYRNLAEVSGWGTMVGVFVGEGGC